MEFKYDVLDSSFSYSSQLESYLNGMGKQGWEMVNCEIRKEKIGIRESIKIVAILKKRVL